MTTTHHIEACPTSVRDLCYRLIELVGRNVYHRRGAHEGVHVRSCTSCAEGYTAELQLVTDIEKAIVYEHAARDADA